MREAQCFFEMVSPSLWIMESSRLTTTPVLTIIPLNEGTFVMVNGRVSFLHVYILLLRFVLCFQWQTLHNIDLNGVSLSRNDVIAHALYGHRSSLLSTFKGYPRDDVNRRFLIITELRNSIYNQWSDSFFCWVGFKLNSGVNWSVVN